MPPADDLLSVGATPAGPVRPSSRLVAGLVVFVLAFGAAGYAWRGNLAALAVGPGQRGAESVAPPHALDSAQFEAMAQRLADRLKGQPDDAEGWAMLGRSYTVLGKPELAVQAWRKVLALRADDAQSLADAADAIATANGRTLAGEPERLIAQALARDPDNPKALALSGTLAFDQGDAARAAAQWTQALRGLEPGSAMARQLQAAVAEARQRAGLPAESAEPAVEADATTGPARAATGTGLAQAPAAVVPDAMAAGASAALPAVAVAASGASAVQARITLDPALAARAAPEDTLFVFVRNADGASRMPLAIQRRRVADLPLELTLDDSMAMSPALRLSGARAVVIGARISRRGDALPQPGDLQGLSAAVAPGARGVPVRIAQVLP